MGNKHKWLGHMLKHSKMLHNTLREKNVTERENKKMDTDGA